MTAVFDGIAIPSQGEMNVTEVDTIVTPLNSFYKGSNGIQRICLNENTDGCPYGFRLVSVFHLLFILKDRMLAFSIWKTRLSSIVLFILMLEIANLLLNRLPCGRM